MKVVELTGSAIRGVEHSIVRAGLYPFDLDVLPTRVALGCINQKKPVGNVLKLSNYLDAARAASSLPESTNYREKAAASIARMYANERLGCCVVSGKAHLIGTWTGNDAPEIALATDAEIIGQYHDWCGPGDQGCIITNVLNKIKSRGMLLNGKLFTIDGYVSADWTNQIETKTVLYLFGGGTIGFNLPQAWTQNAVWDITTSRIVAGHDVTPVDFGPEGVYVSSWGRIYLMTWPAWRSRKWITEFYAILGPAWWGSDLLAPNGVDTPTLRVDLIKIGRGEIPDIDPIPPPPPPPPPPPAPPLPPGTRWRVTADNLDALLNSSTRPTVSPA